MGRRTIAVGPNSTVVATELPAGLRNFSVQVATSLHVDTQLENTKTESLILEGGKLMPEFEAPKGPYHYKHASSDAEQIFISGLLDTDLLLKAINLAKTGGTIQLDYRFDGISPCPEVPHGCQAFDKGAAVKEVNAWSDWAREEYGSVDAAWKAISAAAQGGGDAPAGRRLAAADSISWQGWKNAWSKWDGATSKSSWQESFHLLDVDGDEAISKAEFASGYNGKAGDDAITERGLKESASSSSGGGFPLWILIVVPLLALAAFAVYFLRTHPAALEKLKSKLPGKSSELTQKLDQQEEATDQEKTMFLKTEETTTLPPEENSSFLGNFDTRGKFCSLMSCAWGRSEKPPSPMVLPPSDSTLVEAIVEKMRAAKGDEGVQEDSLKKLEELALDPELKARIAACGGPDCVIEAMYAYPNSPGIQEHACAVLGNQASSSEEQQRSLAEQGAVRAVIKAMIEQSANFRVQETACWAFRELALADAGRKEITDCGGIERVLRAMQTHPAAVAVLEHGCMSLAYLSYDPELRRWIAYDGGVNIIVKAMQSQPDDSVVQEAGCLALRNLSCSQEPQQAILELRGDEAILQAMNTHISSASVQETGCDTLLIVGPSPRRLFEAGALQVIIKAMERYPEVESVQAKACRLLAYAAADDEARSQIRQLNGLELVGNAQVNFPESPEVGEASLEAMSILERG